MPTLATDRRRPAPLGAAAVAVVLAALLAGCGAGGGGPDGPASRAEPGSTSAATAHPAAPAPAAAPDTAAESAGAAGAPGSAPQVPVRDAALDAVPPAAAAVPPVGLALPRLGVTVPVDPVGVQADGQMEIPPRAERAGWYRFGAAPGEADGTAVVAAHVDSVASAGLGPFARLREAEVGDAVEVTLADGATVRYAVTAVERRAKPEIVWADVFVRDGRPRLVLITCGGTFQRDVGHYSDNVMVTAEPVGA